MPAGLTPWGHRHNYDVLSGGFMSGTNGFFASNKKSGWFPIISQHRTSSFVKNITSVLGLWQSSGGDNKKLTDGFIKTMQTQYGIKVTLVQ